ncbi:hypothetical protein Stube_59720 [Streptomyces tubercidicus]|uniref:Uncharacterized protein n=1 Tax=Streptomyces tubercidicus TaxID=47759 RepID=A0A640UZG6_9ACTN|nr:hypothetical protein Stube_59720 [Streptomyces tubercidicus]
MAGRDAARAGPAVAATTAPDSAAPTTALRDKEEWLMSNSFADPRRLRVRGLPDPPLNHPGHPPRVPPDVRPDPAAPRPTPSHLTPRRPRPVATTPE